MPHYIIPHNVEHAGLCYWLTDTPHDEESGISGAGYTSVLEAVIDATGDSPAESLSQMQVCDLTDLSPMAFSELFPLNEPRRDLMRLLDARSVPFYQWLMTHLQTLNRDGKLVLA